MHRIFESQEARLSWVWITAMLALTSIHHIFRLGYELLIPTLILTLLPYALLRGYAATGNIALMKIYSLYSALMFMWFGLIDGFLDHVLKVIGLDNLTFLPGGEAQVVKTALSLWSPAAGQVFYEGTGVLTFIAGVFGMIHLVRMIRARHAADKTKQLNMLRN